MKSTLQKSPVAGEEVGETRADTTKGRTIVFDLERVGDTSSLRVFAVGLRLAPEFLRYIRPSREVKGEGEESLGVGNRHGEVEQGLGMRAGEVNAKS